jgi:hypothetical protein
LIGGLPEAGFDFFNSVHGISGHEMETPEKGGIATQVDKHVGYSIA